jgi:hypothetical protein
MLTGEEKLSDIARQKVLLFCEKHPEIKANYALKQDIRTLYATAQNPAQGYAYKDILDQIYANILTR